MNWRERTDLWYGKALVRPRDRESPLGGAYVNFIVVDKSLPSAVEKLGSSIAEHGWILSSLESMKLAHDYFGQEEADAAFDAMAAQAAQYGCVLRAFHTFPRHEQLPS